MLQPHLSDRHRAEPASWQVLAAAMDELKEAFERADRAALGNAGAVPPPVEAELRWRFRGFCLFLDEQLGAAAPGSPQEKEALGARVRRELFPYLLLGELTERLYSKPRGYAGDFMSIEMIYADAPSGRGRIGPLVDRCLLDLPAAVAVRNRRQLMASEIGEVLASRGGEAARVTSLACGPATELFDAYAAMPEPSRLLSTAVDLDLEALAFVGARREPLRLERCLATTRANLVHVARGGQALPLEGQDLVYSIGLVDYFPDPLVIALLSWIFETLRPGGKAILGNFHPRNPTRALMDHVLDWRLRYRSEEDMHRLFRASRFGRRCTEIRFEAEGINLFAACTKAR